MGEKDGKRESRLLNKHKRLQFSGGKDEAKNVAKFFVWNAKENIQKEKMEIKLKGITKK